MDLLQEQVADAVGEAALRGEDAAITFDFIRELTDGAAGAPKRPGVAARLAPNRPRPPRLTESWFC